VPKKREVEMQDFRKLRVWKKAYDLVLRVYIITKGFPREELYGITSQIRRSAASITANISEGCGRKTKMDLCRFLMIALGSLNETENFLLLSRDLSYLSLNDFEEIDAQLIETRKMLISLENKVDKESKSSRNTHNSLPITHYPFPPNS
jgi:four helix bundle protein